MFGDVEIAFICLFWIFIIACCPFVLFLSKIHRMLSGKDLPCHKEAATGSMELGSMPDGLLDNETSDVVVDAFPLVPKDGQEPPSDI